MSRKQRASNSDSANSAIIPRLLRIQDVARYISATNWFVEELIRDKKIRFLVLGKRRVIDVNDLNDWIEMQKQEPPRSLTDEEAQRFFDGCERDQDGNYILRVHDAIDD